MKRFCFYMVKTGRVPIAIVEAESVEDAVIEYGREVSGETSGLCVAELKMPKAVIDLLRKGNTSGAHLH